MEMPFEYGTHDCVMFVLGAISCLLGVDVTEGYLGTYKTANGALRKIKKATGGTTVVAVMDYLAKTYPDAIKRASNVLATRRGDVVCVENNGELSLGIVSFNGKYAWFVGEKLTPIRVATCIKAWHIG